MLANLDRLKTFYHVVSQGSVGGAAEALHVTQPAVSQAIQKLEDEISTPLFIRQHKQLIPTMAGERLFAVVEPFMNELETCLVNIDRSHDEPFGELRIGAPLEVGKAYLPAIMAGFRKQYPGVTFQLEFGNAEKLLSLVEEGRLELALVDLFLVEGLQGKKSTHFQFESVLEENVILGCSKVYYESRQGRPLLEWLLEQDFVEYTLRNRPIRYWFKHHFNLAKVDYRVGVTVNSHEAVMSAIKHHAGLGALATHLAAQELQSGEIVPIVTDKDVIVNDISMVSLQGKEFTLTERVFKEYMLERVRQFGFSGRA